MVTRLPYFPEQICEFLGDISQLVLCGAGEPVAFFGYPDRMSRPTPDSCQVVELAAADSDIGAALDALAARLGAVEVPVRARGERPAAPTGALHPGTIGQALAALQPENAIIMDESATTGFAYGAISTECPPHTLLGLTGGAIGQGLPCATGASVACPDRPVIAFQADGSGMYTLQALWTQAREALDVTTLICANREYRILRVELGRADIAEPGPTAESLTSLRNPTLDWCHSRAAWVFPA